MILSNEASYFLMVLIALYIAVWSFCCGLLLHDASRATEIMITNGLIDFAFWIER